MLLAFELLVIEDGSYKDDLEYDFVDYALFHFGLLTECFRAAQLFSGGTIVCVYLDVLGLKGLVNIYSCGLEEDLLRE